MTKSIVLAIHGGAGTLTRQTMTPEKEQAYKSALEAALLAGYDLLQQGKSSVDAVCAAVRIMEDSPLFNAGKGAVLTHDGKVELDAAVMNGENLAAGAIAQATEAKNPIDAARAVMEHSNHVMLAAKGADDFIRDQGLATVTQDYFITEARYQQLLAVRDQDSAILDHDGTHRLCFADKKFGTVGAVAMDQKGHLAAATSTGGLTNKRWGRIGDSPVIGAGTYANDACCAVSATGTGETFLRACAAHDIAARIRYLGETAEEAGRDIMKKIGHMGGQGGLIIIDQKGQVAMPFNTEGMYRGTIGADGNAQVSIYKD